MPNKIQVQVTIERSVAGDPTKELCDRFARRIKAVLKPAGYRVVDIKTTPVLDRAGERADTLGEKLDKES